jgi:hypothetical protein
VVRGGGAIAAAMLLVASAARAGAEAPAMASDRPEVVQLQVGLAARHFEGDSSMLDVRLGVPFARHFAVHLRQPLLVGERPSVDGEANEIVLGALTGGVVAWGVAPIDDGGEHRWRLGLSISAPTAVRLDGDGDGDGDDVWFARDMEELEMARTPGELYGGGARVEAGWTWRGGGMAYGVSACVGQSRHLHGYGSDKGIRFYGGGLAAAVDAGVLDVLLDARAVNTERNANNELQGALDLGVRPHRVPALVVRVSVSSGFGEMLYGAGVAYTFDLTAGGD